MQSANSKQQGFSLIELMVALAIIGILAAVAYPAYTSHVKRGQHSEALAVLNLIAANLEVYASSNGDYTGATIATVYDPTGKHAVTNIYDFSLTNTAASFSVEAIPKAVGPLADEGSIILYWDGRKGWDSDDDGSYEVINF